MAPPHSDARQKRHRPDHRDNHLELEDLHPTPPPSVPEVLAGAGFQISDFPVAVKRAIHRPHSSVLSIVASEKGHGQCSVVLENLSYGQLQALSAVPSDNLVLGGFGSEDQDGSLVIRPPQIREGRGVAKRFWNRVHILPLHADWFQPTTVHRLERQLVPHFFCGKSAENTPEKYMDCRNLIVAKYMENPEMRLSVADCQGLAVGIDKVDLDRIVCFLDHWGIINYCAPEPLYEYWSIDAYLRENPNGEVVVPSATLTSIDSLIKFDKPNCRLKPHKVYSSLSENLDDIADLDSTLREILSESRCKYCFRSMLAVQYQSVKEIVGPQGSLAPNNVNTEASSIPTEKVKCAAKAGLAAATLKAKVCADHEEREIQRLSASIINNQLKRLELKLKQFAEVETLLMKESEQVEKTRQRLVDERVCAISARFGGLSGVASSMDFAGGSVAPQVVASNNNNIHNNINMSNIRTPIYSSPLHSSISGYPNNQMTHSQMAFMPHQQMFSFRPRLPLSAIQASSSPGLSSSSMFGAHGSGDQASLTHPPMLRPSNSGMG